MRVFFIGDNQACIQFSDRTVVYRLDGSIVGFRPNWITAALDRQIKVAIDSLSDRLDRPD